jgi:hypothetical protein
MKSSPEQKLLRKLADIVNTVHEVKIRRTTKLDGSDPQIQILVDCYPNTDRTHAVLGETLKGALKVLEELKK